MKRACFFALCCGGLISLLFPRGSFAEEAAAAVDYHTDVAPILRDYCAGCHNEGDYEGEFSVETFRALSEGGESGESALVPGKVAESFFAATILKKAKPHMPPKKEPQLSDEQIALLTRWIEEGAKGPAPDKDQSILSTLNVPDIKPAKDLRQPVTAAAFSKDGKSQAQARFGRIELNDGSLTVAAAGKVNAVHFSPGGGKIITASGITGIKGMADLWDVRTGKQILSVGAESHRDTLYDAEISPDGKLIATAGYDKTIRLWEADTGKHVRTIRGHNGAVFDVAFSPDSSLLASASADQTGKVWRVSDGQRLDTLNQPQGEQFRIAFTPDGKFILGCGADKKIRLWRLRSRTKPAINPVVHARFAHEEAVTHLAVSPHGKWIATAAADGAVKIWSLPALRLLKIFPAQPDLVSALVFHPNGDLFTAWMNGGSRRTKLDDLSTAKSHSIGYRPQSNRVPSGGTPAKITEFTEGKGDVLEVALPAQVRGVVSQEGDTDDYLFSAKKGQSFVVEINAARSKSPLDSKVEILRASGEKIERVVLRAVRDSWFTFRGKDSNTSDDFRVHNWREMELNEFLYADGEVVKLWHYPRGPDSGFKVYPGFGNRRTYFDTTALSHPLGGPCHIVEPLAPGSEPAPNGLPVYRLFWENDDDSARELGSDSRMIFDVPEDGDYLVRISDVRGFGGEEYSYQLTIREPVPDFSVKHNGANLKISPGSGQEIEFVSKPVDGFEGAIEVRVENLPPGFHAYPVTIEKGQRRAYLAVRADENAKSPSADQLVKIKVTARSKIAGKEIEKTLPGLASLGIGKPAKVKVDIFPDRSSEVKKGTDGFLELELDAGETVSALVKAERIDFKGQINFGKDDSGRNLPHGVYVDNIGLNGLMIPAGKMEQRFWITAAKWVPDTEWIFHLRSNEDGRQTTRPVRIRVRGANSK